VGAIVAVVNLLLSGLGWISDSSVLTIRGLAVCTLASIGAVRGFGLGSHASRFHFGQEVWKNRLTENFDSTREILSEMEAARVTAETEAANRANAGKGADGKATDGKNRAIGDPAKAGQKQVHNRDNGAHPDSADGDGIASNDPRLTAALAGVTQAAQEAMNRSPQLSWTQAYRRALNAARAAGQIPADLVSV
jgi:hypothetical protein